MILNNIKVPILFVFQYLVLSNILAITLDVMIDNNLPSYVLIILNGLQMINNWTSFVITQMLCAPFIGYRFLIQNLVSKLVSTTEFNDSWTLTVYILTFYMGIIIGSLYCINELLTRFNRQVLLELEEPDEPSNIVTGNNKEFKYDVDSKENIFSDKVVESVEKDISQLKEPTVEETPPPIPPRPSPESIAKKSTFMNRFEQFKESKLTPYWKQIKEKSLNRFTKSKPTETVEPTNGTDDVINGLIAVINSRGTKLPVDKSVDKPLSETESEEAPVVAVKDDDKRTEEEPKPDINSDDEIYMSIEKEPSEEVIIDKVTEQVVEEVIKETIDEVEKKHDNKEAVEQEPVQIFEYIIKDVNNWTLNEVKKNSQPEELKKETVTKPIVNTAVSMDDVMLMPFKGKMYYINDLKGKVYDAIPNGDSHQIGMEVGTCNMGTIKLYKSESNFNPVFG